MNQSISLLGHLNVDRTININPGMTVMNKTSKDGHWIFCSMNNRSFHER